MLYTGPIAVFTQTSIKAQACTANYTSPVISADYTIDLVKPATPTALTATAISQTQIDLAWSPSSDNVTAQQNLVYEVCKATAAGGCTAFVTSFTTTAGAQMFSVTGLSAATPYFFVIRAKDGVGNASAVTAEVTATTINLATTAATPTFSPVQGAYNVTQAVAMSSSTTGATICYTTTGVAPACAVGFCNAGTLYASAITVSAVTTVMAQACAAGLAPSAVNTAVYTVDTAAPTAPTGVTALRSPLEFGNGRISWTAAADTVSAAANLTYQICQSTTSGNCNGAAFTPTYTTLPGQTVYGVSGLLPATTYYYVVRALDALGNVSAGSTEFAFTYLGTFGPTDATASMASARYYHTATPLPNGKVLITGGHNGMTVVATAEIFDPAGNAGAGTFSATASMASARYGHTATLLPNGKVLISGGWDAAVPVGTAEIFDPAGNAGAGTFTATASMASTRYYHTATLLANGKVLITGGWDGATPVVATAEIFDPAGNAGAGTFTATASMSSARYVHTATLLPNGKVLITGGLGAGVLATAELYW